MKSLFSGLLILSSVVAFADPRYQPQPRPPVVVPTNPGTPAPMPPSRDDRRDDRDHRRPRQRMVEMYVSRDVNQALGYRTQALSLRSLVSLPVEAYAKTLFIVASSTRGRGSLNVYVDGRLLTTRTLGDSFEAAVLPLEMQSRNFGDITIAAQGRVRVASVAVSYFGGAPLPPVPQGPLCEVLGYGPHARFNYAYRIRVNNQIVDAADNFNDVLAKLQQLERARVCAAPMPLDCRLDGYGPYRNFNYGFRLQTQNGVIQGEDNLDQMLRFLETARQAGVCDYESDEQACQLLGPGNYRGFNYRHRVTIGNEVIVGSDNLNDATRTMEALRNARLCY